MTSMAVSLSKFLAEVDLGKGDLLILIKPFYYGVGGQLKSRMLVITTGQTYVMATKINYM